MSDNYEGIHFYDEDSGFALDHPDLIKHWIKSVFEQEKCEFSTINYIFCSDNYLYELNMKYLNHDTLTDVITFAYNKTPVEGDIFISIDRIEDNAGDYEIDPIFELYRVMVHGILHLIGYNDKTPEEQQVMRNMENKYLLLLNVAPN